MQPMARVWFKDGHDRIIYGESALDLLDSIRRMRRQTRTADIAVHGEVYHWRKLVGEGWIGV